MQVFEDRFPFTAKTFELALNTNFSNAGAEGDFSLVTWLTSARRTQTSVRTLNSQLSVMRNGKPLQEVPSSFFEELVDGH